MLQLGIESQISSNLNQNLAKRTGSVFAKNAGKNN